MKKEGLSKLVTVAHLFEIKDALGEQFEAEMWDKGWTKVFEVVPVEAHTDAHQAQFGQRMAEVITYLHPILWICVARQRGLNGS